MRRGRAGFTLIEVMAVVLLTGILIGFTTNFYLNLSRASTAAVEKARNARRAVVLLDRMARDLQAAMLVRKPEALDPMLHPWLFLAEADDPDLGAQRIKFTSLGRRPRSSQAAESDLETVVWMLARGEHDDFELRRWSSPRLPPARDLSFPAIEETLRVADRIARFGVFFVDEAGGVEARWDSSALVQSSELPMAAEIQVSFYVDDEGQQVDGPYVRRVTLPLRPLDLAAQLEAAGAGPDGAGLDSDGDGIPDAEEDEDGDGVPDGEQEEAAGGAGGMTGAECLAASPALQALFAALGPQEQAVAQSLLPLPVGEIAPVLAQIGIPFPPECR